MGNKCKADGSERQFGTLWVDQQSLVFSGRGYFASKIYFFIIAFHRKLEVKAMFNSLLLLLLQVEHCHTLRRDFEDTHFPLWTAPSTGKKVSSKKHQSLMSGLQPSLSELYSEWVNYSTTICSRPIWSIRLYFLDTQKCKFGWCQWKWPQCISAQLLGGFSKALNITCRQ